MSTQLVITPGDIAGVGPEVMLRAWDAFRNQFEGEMPSILFAGPKVFWEALAEKLEIEAPNEFLETPELLETFPEAFEYGKPQAACGRFAMQALKLAAEYCQEAPRRALVTAPINKAGIHMAGYTCMGHTDYLAQLTKTESYAMAFSTPNLKVVLVTHHQPLKTVSNTLTTEGVLEKIILANTMARTLGAQNPRVAVCGLNPHAGENGILGAEESEIILPAIEDAALMGVNAIGPLPSDSVFHFAKEGNYDIVVAMYHDQGLIPVKLLDFNCGVNITLGLPFARTSPDHGTAYDIAEEFTADYGSALEAIKLAARLA